MIDQIKQIPSFFFPCIISPNVLDIAYISLEYSDKIEAIIYCVILHKFFAKMSLDQVHI